MSMIQTNIRFTKEQINGLKSIWKDTGASMSESIRRAVDEYLGKRKARKSCIGASDPGHGGGE